MTFAVLLFQDQFVKFFYLKLYIDELYPVGAIKIKNSRMDFQWKMKHVDPLLKIPKYIGQNIVATSCKKAPKWR